jgi:hypothetical protein
MEVILVLAVLAVAVYVIVGPLRASAGHRGTESGEEGERRELEAAKEAKLREIREAELDFRTGKLSREDWRTLDSSLRSEAIELLRRLDSLEEERPGGLD